MEKIELSLLDIYNINTEINGFVDNQTGESLFTGLLKEKILLTTKYWLTDLFFTIQQEIKLIDEIKNTLIKKYGEEDGNRGISVSSTVKVKQEDGSEKEIINPSYEQFHVEFNEFLKTTKEIEYHPILLSELKGIDSAANYPTLFRKRIVKPD